MLSEKCRHKIWDHFVDKDGENIHSNVRLFVYIQNEKMDQPKNQRPLNDFLSIVGES